MFEPGAAAASPRRRRNAPKSTPCIEGGGIAVSGQPDAGLLLGGDSEPDLHVHAANFIRVPPYHAARFGVWLRLAPSWRCAQPWPAATSTCGAQLAASLAVELLLQRWILLRICPMRCSLPAASHSERDVKIVDLVSSMGKNVLPSQARQGSVGRCQVSPRRARLLRPSQLGLGLCSRPLAVDVLALDGAVTTCTDACTLLATMSF